MVIVGKVNVAPPRLDVIAGWVDKVVEAEVRSKMTGNPPNLISNCSGLTPSATNLFALFLLFIISLICCSGIRSFKFSIRNSGDALSKNSINPERNTGS